MYKHICVKCLEEHNLKCIWNIGFIDRLLGNINVKYCSEYIKIMKKVEENES